MNRHTLGVLAAAVILLGAAPFSGAQQVIRHVYTNTVSVKSVIHGVERESNSFRELFERRYHNVFISNWRRTDDSRAAVQALDRALEHVRFRVDSGEKPKYVRDDVVTVVQRARVIDRMMSDPDQVLSTMSADWQDLKNSIDDLAAVYELRGV